MPSVTRALAAPAPSPLPVQSLLLPPSLLLAACAGGPTPGVQGGAEGTTLRWGGDVLAAGPTVQVADSVPGDAMLSGADIRFTGQAGGSVLGAGRDVEVGGRTAGSVRAAGASVRIRGAVERNVTLAGGEVRIEESATVGRNAYLAGRTVEVVGAVDGSLRVAGGDVLLDGPVAGDVDVEGGTLRVGSGARIGGDLRHRIDEGEPARAPDAEVGGEVVGVSPAAETDGTLVVRLLRILAFLLVGTVVVGVAPRAARTAADFSADRTAASLGLGVLGLVLVPMAVLLVAVTVIGLPLAGITAVLYLVALYLAPVAPALWLGDRITEGLGGWRSGAIPDFLVGGAVVGVAVFLPVLGLLVRILLVALGLGAAALALRERRRATAAGG